MNFLAKKITLFLIKKNIINGDDKEIYEYSFEVLISTIINFLILIIVMLITKRYVETVVFSVVFIITRRLVGGYHSKTHIGCTFSLIAIYAGLIFSISNFNYEKLNNISVLLIIPFMIIILIFAPVGHYNNPLDDEKTIQLRLKGIIFTSILSFIILFLSYYNISNYSFIMAYTEAIVSLLLILGYLENYYKKAF